MKVTHVHKDYQHIAPQLWDAIDNFETMGAYVTKGERNVIKKVEIKGEVYNIKKFKTPNAVQRLVYRYLRKSKAKRSFQYAKIFYVNLKECMKMLRTESP